MLSVLNGHMTDNLAGHWDTFDSSHDTVTYKAVNTGDGRTDNMPVGVWALENSSPRNR